MTSVVPLPTGVRVLTCDNPSPMTLEGTNTYLLGDAETDSLAVVDPGPDGHPEHLQAVTEAAGDQRIGLILITHRHSDHVGGAAELARITGAPVRSFDPEHSAGAEPLRADERIRLGTSELEVLHTPGHTSDSVSFWLPGQRAMITGDTVLGRGTTMLDHPDGTLTDYLASLDQLAQYGQVQLLPAHGPTGADLGPVVAQYREHRLQRLDQVTALLDEHGPLTAAEVARLVYGDQQAVHNRVLETIAAAQLDHLRATG